ncbi:MAG: hypothetical protein AAFY57_05505 [Cyanobacteria bacterium J06642_2]
MSWISTEQFDRTENFMKTAARHLRQSWPARVLRTLHHESYQSVQSQQARWEKPSSFSRSLTSAAMQSPRARQQSYSLHEGREHHRTYLPPSRFPRE